MTYFALVDVPRSGRIDKHVQNTNMVFLGEHPKQPITCCDATDASDAEIDIGSLECGDF